jgi:platelet-activating factor acetylhydrolase
MLRSHERFPYFTQAIILDLWGAGTRPLSEDDPDHRIQVPLLAINSEAFTYWPVNFEKVDALVKEAQDGLVKAPAWLMTVRGTVHISQSDFVLLYPNLCSLFLKAVASPRRALDININASLEFLKQVMPHDLTGGFRSFDNENILQSDLSPLEQIPSSQLHRPNDKWVAARLKIRHEWAYRMSPKLFRKLKRAKAQHEGKEDDTGNEVWLHSKPDDELVEEHRDRMKKEAEGVHVSRADQAEDLRLGNEEGEASDSTTLHTD